MIITPPRNASTDASRFTIMPRIIPNGS
jgi:hypothetical protein